MFGKINLALGIQSKPQVNQHSSSSTNTITQQRPNTQTNNYSKPLLSNPKFVQQKPSQPTGKQYKPDESTKTNPNKTKPIQKEQFSNSKAHNNNKNNKKNQPNKPQVSSF